MNTRETSKMITLTKLIIALLRILTRKRDRWSERIRVRYYSHICGSMGSNVRFSEGVLVQNPSGLFIGNNVGINRDVWINAGGRVEIGDDVIIGPKVIIHSANHKFDSLDIPIRLQGWVKLPVVIEEDVWIAGGVIILPRVRIGKGSVIAAGAVVTKDIPSYSIAMGVPAAVKGSRKTSTRCAEVSD